MVAGPQRRFLPGRLRPAVSAPAHGPRARLPGRQRRGRAAGSLVVSPLVPANARRTAPVPSVRYRLARGPARRQPVGARLRAPGPCQGVRVARSARCRGPGGGEPGRRGSGLGRLRMGRRTRLDRSAGRDGAEHRSDGAALCFESEPLRPAGRAEPRPLGGPHTDRAPRTGAVPEDHVFSLFDHAGALRHLLVRARGALRMPPSPETLEALVIPYLERQPWFLADMSRFNHSMRVAPQLADLEIVLDGRPGLASVVVTVGER